MYFGIRALGFWLIHIGREQERAKAEREWNAALLEVYLCPSCLKYTHMGRPCEYCGTGPPEKPSVAVLTRSQAKQHNATV